MTEPILFHADVLNAFKHIVFGESVRFEDLQGEIAIKKEPYWLATIDKKQYLIPPEFIKDLPFKIEETKRRIYRNKVYHEVVAYKTLRFKAEKKFSLAELVDEHYNPFEHTNIADYINAKILTMTAYLRRVNLRIAATAEFGKDSLVNYFHHLMGDAVSISPKSLPAIEYRLLNKLIALNELGRLDSSSLHEIEHFLLDAGAFANVYEKPTRASSSFKTRDRYDISNLSLILFSNLPEEYSKEKDFFDNAITNKAILTRYLPFRFEGKLKSEQFSKAIPNAYEIAESHLDYFLDICHTIRYYQENIDEVKDEAILPIEISHKFEDKPRQLRIWNEIALVVYEYAERNEEVARATLMDIYENYKAYYKSEPKNGIITQFIEV